MAGALSGPGTWDRTSASTKGQMRDNARTLLGQINEQRAPFSRADLQAVRASTLLLGGERSPPPFPQILDAMERTLANVQRITVTGASHPFPEENPEAFNRAVLEFVAAH